MQSTTTTTTQRPISFGLIINMAGTRLLIQSVVLLELLGIIGVSFYVGFCHPHLRFSGGKQFPPPTLKSSDYYQQDELCTTVIDHIMNFFNDKDDDNIEDQQQSLTKAVVDDDPTIVSLQIMLILEDITQIQYWSTKLNEEYQIPSYVEGLHTIQISKPIQIHTVPSLVEEGTVITESTIQSIWKHLYDNDVLETSKVVENPSLIIYIPSYIMNKKNDASTMKENEGGEDDHVVVDDTDNEEKQDVDDAEASSSSTPPPTIWSYEIDIETSYERPWILIPSTTDIENHVKPIIDTWMIQKITAAATNNNKLADDDDWWRFLSEQWKLQTQQLYNTLDDLPKNITNGIMEILDDDFDNKTDNDKGIYHDIAFVSRLQDTYLYLQWLRDNGIATRRDDDSVDGSSLLLTPDFPIEHYAAIFLPLLFPLLVPFLVSFIKEYKRWKQKKRDKEKEKDDDVTDYSGCSFQGKSILRRFAITIIILLFYLSFFISSSSPAIDSTSESTTPSSCILFSP